MIYLALLGVVVALVLGYFTHTADRRLSACLTEFLAERAVWEEERRRYVAAVVMSKHSDLASSAVLSAQTRPVAEPKEPAPIPEGL